MRSFIPQDILDLAHARAAARRAQDWPEADRLKAAIEAAGWKVVDTGADFRLDPARPPDLVEDGRTHYGSSASVPSRAGEPATAAASIVVVATDRPEELARTLTTLRRDAPDSTHVIVVADGPDPEQRLALGDPTGTDLLAPIAGADPEVVWTATRQGRAAAINIGCRVARGEVVVLLDTSVEPTGDIVTPLIGALRDPAVGVAGAFGLGSVDGRRFTATPAGEVDALESALVAFRRADATARGPIDERFRVRQAMDAWWSLVLRDEGPDAAPRHALALALPVIRHPGSPTTVAEGPDAARLEKRDRYRIIDRFGHRRDLLVHGAATASDGS